MNIAIICDITNNIPVGVIGVDKSNGNVGFISKDKHLDNVLDIIINNDNLQLQIEESINDNLILRVEEVNSKNSNYLSVLNHYLPYPWKILGIKYIDGELESSIQEAYEYMEVLKNE